MYRPKDWKNPHSILPEYMEQEYPVLPEWSAYEAGADAMLEGLKAEGCRVPRNAGFHGQRDSDGKWVFIPDQAWYDKMGIHP